MLFVSKLVTGLLGLSSLVAALPTEASRKDKRSFEERDGVKHTVFEHADTGVKIDFVTNSGICETTKGVNQYSGYFSVGTNASMSIISLFNLVSTCFTRAITCIPPLNPPYAVILFMAILILKL